MVEVIFSYTYWEKAKIVRTEAQFSDEMGQAFMNPKSNFPNLTLMDESKCFALWTLADARRMRDLFQMQVNGFSIVEAQFESMISFKENFSDDMSADALFGVLDNDHDGRVDGLELLGGIALCCQGSFEEKARFCFELFDFNLNATMSKKEMVMMLMSSISGVNILTGGGEEFEPSIEVLENLVDDAFMRADRDGIGALNYDQFVNWARSNRALMTVLESLTKIGHHATSLREDPALDTDEGELSDDDCDLGPSNQSASSVIAGRLGPVLENTSSPLSASRPWMGQTLEPTNYKHSKRDLDGPDTNLELLWAFGYRAQKCRNNLRYVNSESNPDTPHIVYPTASLGVVFDMETRQQSFYQGHKEQISCLAISGDLVATGEVGSNIHIWTAVTTDCVCIIKGMIKEGIQHVAFAPKRDRIVTVGLDAERTVAVYDMASGEIISSAKGLASPSNVHDIAYSTDGTEVVLVGKKQIKFFRGVHTSKRAIDASMATIGKIGKKQTFFSVTYFHDDAIVGCASGELYRFKNGFCVEKIQAHGEREPILSLYFNANEGVLLTGGKDCLIKTWDYSLKEVGASIDMTENFSTNDSAAKMNKSSLSSSDFAVVSVHAARRRILIGTRGSDIFECSIPSSPSEHHTLTRIACGHSSGEILGLAAHPLADIFATCGGDQTVRVWSARSRDQVAIRSLPCVAQSVAFNHSGELLAVGMTDGSIVLMEASNLSLKVCSTWKHSSQTITDIKFSPDGRFLGASGEDGNIYIYKCAEGGRQYRRFAVCRGHTLAVRHIDFSLNSQYLQSDGDDGRLVCWDMRGNVVRSPETVRDITWATLTCVIGWGMQGIWSPSTPPRHILACASLPDIGDMITGDASNRIHVYRYPSLSPGALFQSYVGHSGPVVSVRFNYNRRLLISVGGDDRTILLWKHEIEEVDMSDDAASVSSSVSSDGGMLLIDAAKEIADVGPGERSGFLEAVKSGRTFDDVLGAQAKTSAVRTHHRDAVKSWKLSVVEPSCYTSMDGTTDCDLTLEWIHGYRCDDCRNNLLYSSAGTIVYSVGAVAIVFSKSTGKQSFLQGVHSDEIIGIAAHPAGQIFATGEAGPLSKIVVWNSSNMKVVKSVEGAHTRGVPLLAFSTSGKLLASVGMDDERTLVVHDWAQGIPVMKTPTHKGVVLCLCFLYWVDGCPLAQKDVVITGGDHHLKFWHFNEQNVKSQNALWGKERRATVMCVASASPGVCVTGTVKGDLLVWQDCKLVSNARNDFVDLEQPGAYPHGSGVVQTLWAIPGEVSAIDSYADILDGLQSSSRYVSGDHLGGVAIWRLVENNNLLRLKCIKAFNVSNLLPPPMGISVRSVCERDGVFLIGTSGSEIFEVAEDSVVSMRAQSEPASKRDTDPPKYDQKRSGQGGAPEVLSARTGPIAVTDVDQSVPQSINGQRLISAHFQGVWGIAMHPCQPVYFTCADDATLRCWSLVEHKLLSLCRLPERARAIDIISPHGREIAVTFNSQVWILSLPLFTNPFKNDLVTVDIHISGVELAFFDNVTRLGQIVDRQHKQLLDPGPTRWVETMKYSFNGHFLAVGSHDRNIYIYHISEGLPLSRYQMMHTLSGHASWIKSMDFGVFLTVTNTSNERSDGKVILKTNSDGKEISRVVATTDMCLQSTCGNQDIMYWRCVAKVVDSAPSTVAGGETIEWSREMSASKMKDVHWMSWSCPVGWPVQGIWPLVDDWTQINGVDRCHNWNGGEVPVIACVDDLGCVKLYNYPSFIPGAPDKCYKGHGRQVTSVRFSFDDSYCVSTGRTDRAVFVWKTDIPVEMRERQALTSLSRPTAKKTSTMSSPIETSSHTAMPKLLKESDMLSLSGSAVEGRITSQPLMAWKSWVREPSGWKDKADELPKAALEMNFVYGYRGWDCRNNIAFAESCFEVVYHVAGIGIVYNSSQHSQIHNTEHGADIVCLSVHPGGHTVATGDLGARPKIVLWDSNTGVTIRTILFHRGGVSHLAFSQSGALLVSVGMDMERSIAVHTAGGGTLLGSGKLGRTIDVFALAVFADTSFVTAGRNCVKFWDLPSPSSPGGELSSKSGIVSKVAAMKVVISAAYLGSDAVTGMDDGSISLWKGRSSSRSVQAHGGPVTAMCSLVDASDPRIVTGGEDGFVHVWSAQLTRTISVNLADSTPASQCPHVQAVNTKDGRLLIGTRACEIYEVNLRTPSEIFRWVQGHFSEPAEVCGLATHKQKFVTCSDDMTVRVWDSNTKQLLSNVSIGIKSRAVAISPDGSVVAVGSVDGRVRVLSSDLSAQIADLPVSSTKIEVLEFSVDGLTLAVGAFDKFIYLMDVKNFSCRARCVGHSGAIAAMDFSVDNLFLQSSSCENELFFWNLSDGSMMSSPTELRDVTWVTQSCAIGWAVQGAWQSNAPAVSVGAMCKTPSGKLLIVADTSRTLKLFNHPCPKEGAKCRGGYKGHTHCPKRVRVTGDGKYAISVGALDKAVIQWRIISK